MTRHTKPSRLNVTLAWLAVVLVAAFIVLGAVWYGDTPGVKDRIWRDLAERPTGPMAFRFILQPLMGITAAVHDGLKDARLKRSPYFWTLLSDPERRVRRLREGVFATARIILLGLAVDMIYQFLVLDTFYPGEAAIVALTLGLLPYFLFRGPAARLARIRIMRSPVRKPGRKKE